MAGRCIVVTGASAGVGRAIAVAFGRAGERVALLARASQRLEAARQEVEAAGGQAIAIPVDVADHEQVEAAAQQVQQAWGQIDVWVNDAMATIFCPVESISPQDFTRATHVTYLGAVWGTMAALKRMKAKNAGHIIQIGSALAYRSIPLQAPYCGAKSALRGFTDSLRSELIHDGSAVQLSMVQLCAFNTPQFQWGKTCMSHRPQPVPPIYQPELAGQAVVWLSHHPKRELWVGATTVQAIIGTMFFPGLLDRLLAKRAWAGQFTPEPLPEHRDNNLYHPVDKPYGIHGRFDQRSRSSSFQLWCSLHRQAVGWVVLVLLLLFIGLLAGR